MSHAIILQQAEHIGPGRIVPVFRDFGMVTDIRRLYRGDEVPTDLDEIRVLVVLDGPMRISDLSSSEYPFLAKEVETLQRLVTADRAALGIGLGAQLLAHAAGAKVTLNTRPGAKPEDSPIPTPEIGWGPVTFPFPGGTEPIVMGLMDGAQMLHWHYDTFELPRLPAPANPAPPPAPPPPTGNSLLSSSRLCKNQAFRFKTRLFGFQYHFELNREGIDAMVAVGQEDIVTVLGPGAEQKIRADTEKFYPRYARLGDRILQNFVQYLKLY